MKLLVPIKKKMVGVRFVWHMKFKGRFLFKKQLLYKDANEILDEFGWMGDTRERKFMVADMIKMYVLYGYDFDEYLLYHFQEKNLAERRCFVANWEHHGYINKLNNPRNLDIFNNKWNTFVKYEKYFMRDMVFCNGMQCKEAFTTFLAAHPKFIIKPTDANGGRDVKIVDAANEKIMEDDLFQGLLSEYHGSFVAEELIVQHPDMAKFHPQSVNTARVTTIRKDSETCIIHPFVRFGQHGNSVDNGARGGILCAVDVDTGRITATADEYGHSYDVHPDSGEQIIGFVVPGWSEIKAFVRELAQVVPDNRYTGWDIAITEDGPVLVEGNARGQFIGWQITEQEGFRDEIVGILAEMKLRY